jgi:hypothetical protein
VKYSACAGRRAMYSLIFIVICCYGEKDVLLWKYSACTGRRAMNSVELFLFADMENRVFFLWKYSTCCTCRHAMYSLDLFLFADMEKRVFYCGNIVCAVRAVVPCIDWIYFYLLIWREECFIVEV